MPAKIDGRTKSATLKFIAAYNAENGRGGVSVASRKFKVTRVTIMRWLADLPKAGKAPAKVKKVKVRKAAKVVKAPKIKKVKRGRKPGRIKNVQKVAKVAKVAKVTRRRGRPAAAKSGMKAFARGLLTIARLQADIAAHMAQLASVVG